MIGLSAVCCRVALSTDGPLWPPLTPDGKHKLTHRLKENCTAKSTSVFRHTHRHILYASPNITLIAKTNSKVDHLTQLHQYKQHTRLQSITHTFRERTRSICALGDWVHSNNPMVNVLLSGSQRDSLTMCTFRTQSLTAA